VNWLGDAVMTTRRHCCDYAIHFPNAHITLFLPGQKLREVWGHHPAINEIITFEGNARVWGQLGPASCGPGKFDLALVLPPIRPRSAMMRYSLRRYQIGPAMRGRGEIFPDPSRCLSQPAPGAVQMRKRTEAEIKALIANPPATRRSPTAAAAHQIHEYLHLTIKPRRAGVPIRKNHCRRNWW